MVLIFLLLLTDFGVLALRRCHSLRRNNASSGVRIFFHCRVWYHKEPCATVFAYCERENMYSFTKQLHENFTFPTGTLYACCTLWMDSYVTLYLDPEIHAKIFGYRVFRLFSLTARCSKCDFWNPGQILS